MTNQGLITIEQMVRREVLCCMSSLVSTSAQGAHWFDRSRARARTTTGQSISMDGCIQRIYADMMAPNTFDSVAPGV